MKLLRQSPINGVKPEWRLDKAECFLPDGFVSLGIRVSFKEDLAG